jgi:lactoylglutathione lyase
MAIFDGLGHIALKVRDLDASIAFYNAIGFPEMLRLLDEKGSPWIVYHRINDNLYLELFPGGKDRTVPAESSNATGLFHLCLTVSDADAAEAKLNQVGIKLSRPRNPKVGIDGNRGMWIEDPDLNRIEIMEMAPGCIQYKAEAALKAGGKPHALSLR